MQNSFFNNETTTLVDGQLSDILAAMNEAGVDSEEYSKYLAYMERLHKLKVQEHKQPVSRDTIVTVLGNLLGILVIVAYEQKHVMTSKGLTQIIRPKGTQ